MRRALVSLCLLPLLATCSDPNGLHVQVDLGDFASRVTALEIDISASPGGFALRDPETVAGPATITTEDVAGNGEPHLVLRYAKAQGYAFGGSIAFRVATGNQRDLSVHVEVNASDVAGLIAGGGGDVVLQPNSEGTVRFALVPRSGPVGPQTSPIDLPAGADIAISGQQVTAVAVCHVDSDEFVDLVIGAASAMPNTAVGQTGAVYVIFGGATNPAAIDLASPPAGTRTFHVYGVSAGDQLGAAVACADVNNDAADDLIIGAPGVQGGSDGSAAGAGAVYVIHGRDALANTAFDLAKVPPATDAPDVTFLGAAANAKLGSALYAANLDADAAAEVLVAEPGAARVHLLAGVAATGGWRGKQVLGPAAPAHVTFTGIPATALGAGDFDGSGSPLDIVLGDPAAKMGGVDVRGAAYVFPAVDPAGTQPLDASAAKLVLVGDPRAQLGAAVLALDVTATGVGIHDLVVGAPGAGDGLGAVLVYRNDGQIFDVAGRQPDYTLMGTAAGGRFGAALGGALSESASRLFVGAPEVTRDTRTSAGAVYVYRGSTGGPVAVEQIFGPETNARLGSAIAGGAIGGNMVPDVLMAAPGSGVAYVRYGK